MQLHTRTVRFVSGDASDFDGGCSLFVGVFHIFIVPLLIGDFEFRCVFREDGKIVWEPFCCDTFFVEYDKMDSIRDCFRNLRKY